MTHRILQVIRSLERSGAEKQMMLLATGLQREQFDVHVCALAGGGPLEADLKSAGVPVTVLGKRWRFDPLVYVELRRHIAHLKPHLVQTWMSTANSYGRAAAMSAGVRRTVASERCVDRWKSWHLLAVDRHLARRTDAITVNSRGVEQFYREQGLPAEKLRLIHNGVAAVGASPVSRSDLLAELGLPEGARLIGAVCRLAHQKRLKDLIWAADLLKVIRDDVHLLVIGDGPLRADLERFVRACRIEDKVHMLGPRSDVPSLMPHFDLLWLASSFEGLPNVIMEAMAASVPVVATDIWGNRELVVHGETGFLVPVGDRANLARYANKILDDGALAQSLGAAGKARIGRDFTVESMVEKHAALYRELLD